MHTFVRVILAIGIGVLLGQVYQECRDDDPVTITLPEARIPLPAETGTGLCFAGFGEACWEWYDDPYDPPPKFRVSVETPIPTTEAPERAVAYRSSSWVTWHYCAYDGGFYGDGGGFCGHMANGQVVHAGSAACSWNWDLGTVIWIDGVGTVICKDRGLLGSRGHIDVFFYYSSEGTACGCQSVSRGIEVLQ